MRDDRWPRLRVADWADTKDTLHMWLQIEGKIRMAHAPAVNHWWHVALYQTARGLTTSAVPYQDGAFEIELDFLEHRLHLKSTDGRSAVVGLEPKTVAAFYRQTMAALDAIGVQAQIHPVPNEVERAIPFAEDDIHHQYDGDAARLFWRQMLQAGRVMSQ